VSGLRCKPGDLAVVVGPGIVTPGLLGRFVIVERMLAIGDVMLPGLSYDPVRDGINVWWVRAASDGAMLPWFQAPFTMQVKRRMLGDEFLRPIRPNDGEDESLSWAGKPGAGRSTVKVFFDGKEIGECQSVHIDCLELP
jgi:hypothetical protein